MIIVLSSRVTICRPGYNALPRLQPGLSEAQADRSSVMHITLSVSVSSTSLLWAGASFAMPQPDTSSPALGPDGDHRKRRRNRTTHSCLNCHATKRMCDRKRPCTRCVQLGIADNCAYQTDKSAGFEPAVKQDESALLARIAELERVVGELRSSAPPDAPADEPGIPTPESSHCSTPPNTSPSTQSEQWLRHTPEIGSTYSSPNPSSYSSNQATGSLESMFAPYGNEMTHTTLACHCLSEADHHRSAMELSLRLRRAADILNPNTMASSTRSAGAIPPEYLDRQMSGMHAFRTEPLLDMLGASTVQRPHSHSHGHSAPSSLSTSDLVSDSFMAWKPSRREF
ncbi:unnamed protein product [Mycena citricolor]|nr:unnamed protein product [Mycena citricolor]